MTSAPACPQCQSTFAYQVQALWTCPECGHEWSASDEGASAIEVSEIIKDANGNPLQAGDAATLIKDLKVKGSSTVIKVGTKIKIIRLVDGDHDLDCKVDGLGPMMLKSQFVKKSI